MHQATQLKFSPYFRLQHSLWNSNDPGDLLDDFQRLIDEKRSQLHQKNILDRLHGAVMQTSINPQIKSAIEKLTYGKNHQRAHN